MKKQITIVLSIVMAAVLLIVMLLSFASCNGSATTGSTDNGYDEGYDYGDGTATPDEQNGGYGDGGSFGGYQTNQNSAQAGANGNQSLQQNTVVTTPFGDVSIEVDVSDLIPDNDSPKTQIEGQAPNHEAMGTAAPHTPDVTNPAKPGGGSAQIVTTPSKEAAVATTKATAKATTKTTAKATTRATTKATTKTTTKTTTKATTKATTTTTKTTASSIKQFFPSLTPRAGTVDIRLCTAQWTTGGLYVTFYIVNGQNYDIYLSSSTVTLAVSGISSNTPIAQTRLTQSGVIAAKGNKLVGKTIPLSSISNYGEDLSHLFIRNSNISYSKN